MQHVLLAKETVPGVQDETVQAILKRVGVKQSAQEAQRYARYGMREKVERNPHQ
jgi:hypothetical protein